MTIKPTLEQLERLNQKTRFTEKEIKTYFETAGAPHIDYKKFIDIATDVGITNPKLQERMWDLFDSNDDGTVETEELILNLSQLLRGDVKDVSRCFFELYDINHDKKIDRAEMIHLSQLFWSETHQEDLTDAQKKRISAFIAQADQDDDHELKLEEFETAIQSIIAQKREKKSFTFYAGMSLFLLFFLTAWFEMGTSFGLPSMGALSLQMKQKLGIDDAAIGALTGYYYIAAVIGPLVGGYMIDKIGPAPILVVANIFVTIGALIQALAGSLSTLIIGRLVMGLGGEVTAFATIEILAIMFPSAFMFMCGMRNLVQSASCFLAFIILPWLAASQSTDTALWFIVLMGMVSLISSGIAWVYTTKKKKPKATKPTAARIIKAFAMKMVPKLPGTKADFKLPLSFFVAIFGIKAFYIPLFSFTAFSIEIFTGPKFSMTSDQAAFLSGFISLLAGLTGPFFGPLSDFLGRRSLMCGFFMAPAVIAFCLFAWFESVSPWVGVTLLAFTYGFGDTCAFVSIRLIVSEKKVGIGYGIYSVIGNMIAFAVPLAGGIVIKAYGQNALLIFFAAIMFVAVVCWIIVRFLEGPKSPLELPAKDLIETQDEVVEAAAMMSVIK